MDAWQYSTHSQASESLPHTLNEMSTVNSGDFMTTSIEQHNTLIMFNEMHWIQVLSFQIFERKKKALCSTNWEITPTQSTHWGSSRTLKQTGIFFSLFSTQGSFCEHCLCKVLCSTINWLWSLHVRPEDGRALLCIIVKQLKTWLLNCNNGEIELERQLWYVCSGSASNHCYV